MGRRSFWSSWFDVNRSTFENDMDEKTIFTFSLPMILTFAFYTSNFSLFTLVQRYISTKLEVSVTFISRKLEARGGRTDRRTGCY